MTENFNILVNKLRAFRKRYYTFHILKGFVSVLFILLLLFVAISLIEYFYYFDTGYRTAVFYGYLVFSALLLVQFVLKPLFISLRKVRIEEESSLVGIIQRYFPEIKDKLQNIIELSRDTSEAYSNDIVVASINQKLNEVKVFDFNEAIKFHNIRKVSYYFILSVIVALVIGVVNKSIYKDSTYRLVHYKQEFEKPAPFEFVIENKNLSVKKGESITLKVRTHGKELPGLVYINIAGNDYLMKSTGKDLFEYSIPSVINPIQFHFSDRKYQSTDYFIKVLPKPGVKGFYLTMEPPAYTGLEKKVYENIGDLTIPKGTKVNWKFQGIDVDSVFLVLQDSSRIIARNVDNLFIAEQVFTESGPYDVIISNNLTGSERALSYTVEVIPDLYPEIRVEQIKDSTSISRFFFRGVISDDYGFSALKFHFYMNENDSSITLPVQRNTLDQDFYFAYDFSDLEPGENLVNYYFSVSDNDKISGYKTTTSNTFLFDLPNREELLAGEKEQFDAIQNKIMESREIAAEIRKDLKNLQIKNMDTNVSDWEKSQLVNEIINKQNKLEDLYDQIQQENAEMNEFVNSFNEEHQEMMEKQKQIEELLEEVFTEELQKLMEEFQRLAEEFNSKKLNQLYDKMELSYEDLQKQIDRNLEMLKKMKIEQKIQNIIDNIYELAENQEEHIIELEENKDFEDLKKSIENDKETLDLMEKELQENLELNKELEEPLNYDDFNEDFQENRNKMDQGQKELDNKRKRKSKERLNESKEMLENMAFGMQQMLDMNAAQQQAEDIQNLRQILGNLVYLSLNQEDIYSELHGISAKDPKLIELNQRQKKIKDQSVIVRDSLYALAMRTSQVSSLVNNELVSLEINLEKTGNEMQEGLFGNAATSQLFVITSLNTLALMLNEALENMEKQMANSQPGNQQCENPGQGNSGMGNLKESAQGIKDQLQKMIDQMKNGQGGNMSKDLGQSLMQHEMMQKMLRDLMNNGEVGSGAQKVLQEIDRMLEQNRQQLLNKNINADMISRHNKITTRLLEAEQAELEREFDNKRESQTAQDFYNNPAEFFEYKEKKSISLEYLNKNAHKLNRFYNKKYKNYLNKVK